MSKYITLVEGDLVCNIPKGMTNGEVIQALFPIERIYKEEYVEVVFKGQYHTTYFTLDFWNAPYKEHHEHYDNLYSCRNCKFRNHCISRKIVEQCSTPYCEMFELEDEE